LATDGISAVVPVSSLCLFLSSCVKYTILDLPHDWCAQCGNNPTHGVQYEGFVEQTHLWSMTEGQHTYQISERQALIKLGYLKPRRRGVGGFIPQALKPIYPGMYRAKPRVTVVVGAVKSRKSV
jgi:hypothetical protein